MSIRACFKLAVLVAVVVLLIGCAAPTPEVVEVEITREVEMMGETSTENLVMTAEPTAWAPPPPLPTSPVGESDEIQTGGHGSTTLPARPNRLIVKNADLRLSVADTDDAIDRITQIAVDCGGYVINSRAWYEKQYDQNYRYATITIGVPVDQFEWVIRRLRNLALRVVDEATFGQDVTDEYVDLQSRLTNLEATRSRIREFLDEAQDVGEALKVNRELTTIEEQIEQVQGRMNYLFDRATYSIITIQVDPELPTAAPTQGSPWNPIQTVWQAGNVLGIVLRGIVEATIWFVIVVAPLLTPMVLVAWGFRRRARRRSGQ